MRLTDFGLSRQMESDEEIACAANQANPNPPHRTAYDTRTTWHGAIRHQQPRGDRARRSQAHALCIAPSTFHTPDAHMRALTQCSAAYGSGGPFVCLFVCVFVCQVLVRRDDGLLGS